MSQRAKPGKPPFEPTPEQRKLVERLVAFGIPEPDICSFIPSPTTGKAIDPKTLRKHFRVELDSGLMKANVKVANMLFNQAMQGKTAAIIFWLKSRARWRETNGVTFENEEGENLGLPEFHVHFVKPPPHQG